MVYFILMIGVLLSLYTFVVLAREQKEGSPLGPLPHFRDVLPANGQNTVDTAKLHALQAKIEDQLNELSKQKEMMMHLMLRVEKKLATLHDKEAHITSIAGQDPNEKTLSTEDLARARLHNEIFALHDQGMTVDEISKQVARGKGEVKLILKLRKK